MSYLPVCNYSWLHIVKQRKKPARSWWKIIGKRIEDIPRDKLKISLLQTLYIFGRILLVLFRTKKCALRELFGDLLHTLFILLLAIESIKKRSTVWSKSKIHTIRINCPAAEILITRATV